MIEYFINLAELKHENKMLMGINSILSLSAETNTFPSGRLLDIFDFSVLHARMKLLLSLDVDCFYLAMLLLNNGLRVSEGLRLAGSQLIDESRALIPASKGSNARYADISFMRNYMQERNLYTDLVFLTITDDYFYRALRRCNIYFDSINSFKNSITHCFRHVYVQNQRLLGIENSVIASNLGLKRVQNVEYYGYGTAFNIYV